ncbi:MAG: RnfH family protein [Proteobacteria bacterium]|nr:RnfH family protein [Pseudomonadota bacterium]
MKVELIYIAEDQTLHQYNMDLPEGATVEFALKQSQLSSICPEIGDYTFGIFSKSVTLETTLKSGDRLEIYRPLQLDPMEKRRLKAKKK